MRRLTLRRRARRNRVARAVEELAVRVLAAFWVVRVLVRGRLSAR